jgi:hypothetical protein
MMIEIMVGLAVLYILKRFAPEKGTGAAGVIVPLPGRGGPEERDPDQFYDWSDSPEETDYGGENDRIEH